MKGREAAKAAQPADLLVCFPSRAHHLTLMPKPLCSPARPSESNKRHHSHLKRSSTRGGAVQASPLLWAKNKQMGSEISEPTSPKVTCAGQIKIRHKVTRPCKSWQSVMEEIERIHNNRKQKKKTTWAETFGFKKEVMQFLTCLRNIKLDFRCFGAFPASDITTEDEGEDEEGEEFQETEAGAEESESNEASRTVFSKWFMVLQENQNSEVFKDGNKGDMKTKMSSDDGSSALAPAVPPPNALLLMRCRSAPAKGWLKKEEKKDDYEQEEREEGDKGDEGNKERKSGRQLRLLMEEEKKEEQSKKNKENLVVMKCDTDFYKISTDIAKETWVVDGMKDPFSRSRSWKR